MTVHDRYAATAARSSHQIRPQWPEPVMPTDPDVMHPRAVAMAEAMREGATTFRGLIAAGFTAAEITEFHREAEALATARADRQVSPGADLLAEMTAKACAAIHNRRPMPKGTTETQALFVAWGRYCAARAAMVVDPWDGQRERCLSLLSAYFRLTPAGETIAGYVVAAVADSFATLGNVRRRVTPSLPVTQ